MVQKGGLYSIIITVALLWGAVRPLSAQEPLPGTTPQVVSGGTVYADSARVDSLAPARLQSAIFRDTINISRMAALSVVAPGFGQLYNGDYWKIPVLYGTVGTLGYFTVDANKKFQRYKRQHEFLLGEYRSMDVGAREFYTEQVEPVRLQMNKYNTQRTIYFAGAALTYLYFMADGVFNYPHPTTTVKRATTLAMMFPGAGQIYNKSYWKVPIVIGLFATMGYLIEWNQRSYVRYRDAFNAFPNDEFGGRIAKSNLSNWRDSRRRDRDLCIILTGAAYALSVIEAHVDAHLKDFDVSDDLSMRVEPSLIDMGNYYAAGNSGLPGVGLALKINF